MRTLVLTAILSFAAFSASAQTATTCKAQADEKKLAVLLPLNSRTGPLGLIGR